MRNKVARYVATMSALAFITLYTPAHAQIANMQDPLNFIISPETPGPNTEVHIEVQGVGQFLGNSVITWKQNDRKVSEGLGKTTYSFTTGGIGSATKINVLVSSTQGDFERTYVFAPSLVELLWEADSSAPLFYLGKPLYSPGSKLKVIAYPAVVSGKSIVPVGQLSFQWSLNDQPATNQSGVGKNVFYVDADILHNTENVKVDVFLNNAKVASGHMDVPTTDPKVLTYNKDPLRGEILDQVLPQTFGLGSSEITIQAEPYYFANQSKLGGLLTYNWTLNNSQTYGPDSNRGILTLRQTGQGSGAASIGITVQNSDPNALVQSARAALNILFGATPTSGSNPFGI